MVHRNARWAPIAVLMVGLAIAPPVGVGAVEAPSAGEILYNGIQLPAEWPPRQGPPTAEAMRVPWLEKPPAVIPIDVGRQLFVDDFLIAETDLKRAFHRPEPCPANPVVRPDKEWEQSGKGPFAAVFSDGVWYDPADRLFKMWYMAGTFDGTAYATSRDGIHWDKPALDVVEKGTNLVRRGWRDSQTVWLDLAEKEAARRYKLFTAVRAKEGHSFCLEVRTSPDGIRWSEPVAQSTACGDRSTVFFNPFRQKWVYSLRSSGPRGRDRAYRECTDPIAGATWKAEELFPWVASDGLDPHNPSPDFQNIQPQLYNLDAAPYESLLVGLFSVWQGPENGQCAKLHIQKRNEVFVGFSRDGFHWYRPDRRPFIGVRPEKDAWNWGNVQSAGGGCLVVGDRLYFYHSGRALNDKFWDAQGSTGLEILRRDGFASMDAGDAEGKLLTRPLKFSGKYLFVNADAARGELAAEVVGEDGKIIEPFSRANCRAVQADKTLQALTWKGSEDLAPVGGRPVRLRFFLRSGALYAFWVSPEKSGASGGYVAAGGPGFTGPTDTVGEGAYRAAEEMKQAVAYAFFSGSHSKTRWIILSQYPHSCSPGPSS